jgi:hypothetical protein
MKTIETIIRDMLIAEGHISREEAETLPTMEQMRAAYAACEAQVLQRKDADTRKLGVQSHVLALLTRAKDENVARVAEEERGTRQIVAGHKIIAKQLRREIAIYAEEGPDAAAQLYRRDMRALIAYRRGRDLETMIAADFELTAVHRFANLFDYLPEDARAPLPKEPAKDSKRRGWFLGFLRAA